MDDAIFVVDRYILGYRRVVFLPYTDSVKLLHFRVSTYLVVHYISICAPLKRRSISIVITPKSKSISSVNHISSATVANKQHKHVL